MSPLFALSVSTPASPDVSIRVRVGLGGLLATAGATLLIQLLFA